MLQLHELVFPRAEAQRRRGFDRADTVEALNALYEVVAARIVGGVDQIEAGLIDRDGVWRIDCGRYDYVGPLSGGRALVRRDGLYGFIDRHGREAIAVRYPFACRFHEGRAVVRIGDKYGYIDTEGHQAIPPVFDRAYRFIGGKARVNRCGETFFIDKSDECWLKFD